MHNLFLGLVNNNDFYYQNSTDSLSFDYKITKINDFISKIDISYTAKKDVEGIPFIEFSVSGSPDYYMIPCMNYNGNFWGTGKEPKGMTENGKPWIFPYDRVGVCGCSVAHVNGKTYSVFADKNNSVCSSSLYLRGYSTVFRIYFTYIEYPKVYLRKFEYGDPIINKVSLKSGEKSHFICYFYEKQGDIYSYDDLFCHLTKELLSNYSAKYDINTVYNWGFTFIDSLLEEGDFGLLSNMGFLPDGVHKTGDKNSTFIWRKEQKFELGWCGQNITIVELYLKRYISLKDKKYLDIAVKILDTWIKRQHENGLVSVMYDFPFNGEEKIDSCNEGWFIYKLSSIIPLLKSIDVDTQKYEKALYKCCDFYIKNFKTGPFPQIINAKGEVVCLNGLAGSIMTVGFLSAYNVLKNPAYLERAKSAFDYYTEKYSDKSCFAGGALDTYCIDKESAGPFLKVSLMFYDIIKEKRYLEIAKKTAYYLMTWTFYHDVVFGKDSDCAKINLKTKGGTSVSTCHNHIDCWGLFYCPEFVKLYNITGSSEFLIHAKAMYDFTVQYISDGKLKLHGMTRPIGAQNEAVIQCNWHWRNEEKGLLNDWLVSWVKVFQLDAIDQLKELNQSF